MTLNQLIENNRRKLNNFRTLTRILDSTEFEICFPHHDDKLLAAVDSADIEGIKAWIRMTLKRELCEYSISELRRLASELGIRNYTLYPKEALLIAIAQVKNDPESKQTKDPASGMPRIEQSVETVHC